MTCLVSVVGTLSLWCWFGFGLVEEGALCIFESAVGSLAALLAAWRWQAGGWVGASYAVSLCITGCFIWFRCPI